MNRRSKIIVIILIVITILSFATKIYALGVGDLTGLPYDDDEFALKKVGNGIVKVITTIGMILSVIILIILGFKYMLGSIEEKAQYKKSLMPYVIGSIVLFSASGIAQFIYEFAISI